MKSRKNRWSLALRYILLLLGGAVSVMPMIYMISTSLKPNGALYEFPPKFFPALDTITLENYVYIFSQEKFYINFLNSVIVAVLTVVIAAFVSSALAFCLARFRFPGRKVFMLSFLLTNAFPKLGIYTSIGILFYKYNLIGYTAGRCHYSYDQLHDVHGLAPMQRLSSRSQATGGSRSGRRCRPHPHLLPGVLPHGDARHYGCHALYLPRFHGRGAGFAAHRPAQRAHHAQ